MILGVNAPPPGRHDPAACLVRGDGTLLAFCEEERLSRVVHAERMWGALAGGQDMRLRPVSAGHREGI